MPLKQKVMPERRQRYLNPIRHLGHPFQVITSNQPIIQPEIHYELQVYSNGSL